MRIVIDATVLARQKKTGIDYYTRNLLRATVAEMPEDSFKLAYMAPKEVNLGINASNSAPKRYLPFPERFYSGLLHYLNVIPFNLLSRTKGDIYIFPNFSRPPLLGSQKSIVFIYDLAFTRKDAVNTLRHKRFLNRQIKDAVKRSSHIVVCSENTKKDLVDLYNAKTSAVSVIYPAVDEALYSRRGSEEVRTIRTKYNLPNKYILYLGTIEPRKNLTRLMQAYVDLNPDMKAKYALVLVGGKGWLDEEIEARFSRLCKTNTIIRTGYVPEQDKPALYSGASLFVYPALYEGFGMPVLEAMACGAPVVTSNNSSLPEVVGDTAITVDPLNTRDITEAMAKVLNDDSLADKMAVAGLERAKTFRWEDGGKKLKSIIDKVCKS